MSVEWGGRSVGGWLVGCRVRVQSIYRVCAGGVNMIFLAIDIDWTVNEPGGPSLQTDWAQLAQSNVAASSPLQQIVRQYVQMGFGLCGQQWAMVTSLGLTYTFVEHARHAVLVLRSGTVRVAVADVLIVDAQVATVLVRCGTREPVHAVVRCRTFWWNN